MSHNHTLPRPQATPSPAAPARALPDTARLVDEALRQLRHDPPGVPPPAPDMPSRGYRLPATVRGLMVDLGWWQEPVHQRPSAHLEQTLNVLHRYGWGQHFDFSPTGRMCIRGAQTFLEYTGHVTPHDRARAVHHMQNVLAESGISLPFHAWSDLPGQEFSHVKALIHTAAAHARQNGE